jgi:hypothetical protein
MGAGIFARGRPCLPSPLSQAEQGYAGTWRLEMKLSAGLWKMPCYDWRQTYRSHNIKP